MTGTITQRAQIIFRKRKGLASESSHLVATITAGAASGMGSTCQMTSGQNGIEVGLFLPHSGIRFPKTSALMCPSTLGSAFDKPDLVEVQLLRKPGVDLGLFDETVY